MRFKRPSPAMVVACAALFVALGGTSFAAVNYARNAGKVDSKNAFKAKRSRKAVAGGLVATYPGGRLKGQIAHRFLADTPTGVTIGQALSVADNTSSAPVRIGKVAGLGTLTATCTDQAPRAGVEDPQSTVSFANGSGTIVNVTRRIGVNAAQIGTVQSGAVSSVTVRGSNTFEFLLNQFGKDFLVQGTVRQDGAHTADATCLVYGTAVQVGS